MNRLRTPDYMRLLPADVLARFAQGKILARSLVEGLKSGDHRSPYIGTSTEFAEHREYSPGDDPRNLDWRVYGKMDRYCVKQYVEETNLRATILLDCSASMRFSGTIAARQHGNGMSKLDYAKHLAAIVAYLLVRQGDAVGLVEFDSQVRSHLLPGCQPSHLRKMLETLYRSTAECESRISPVIHDIAERIPRRGIVILISDLLDEVPDVIRALYHLRHRKHELILFHVLTAEELTFPFGRATQFRDIEGIVGDVDVDPVSIRREYLRRFNEYLSQLETGCRELPVDYVRFNTRAPYEESLSQFLASRLGR